MLLHWPGDTASGTLQHGRPLPNERSGWSWVSQGAWNRIGPLRRGATFEVVLCMKILG